MTTRSRQECLCWFESRVHIDQARPLIACGSETSGSDSELVQTILSETVWGWFIDDVRIYTCDTPDPSTVSLTYPTGSEVWKPGENETITWTGPSKMAYATLKYSLDKGATWKTIEKNLTGTEYVVASSSSAKQQEGAHESHRL